MGRPSEVGLVIEGRDAEVLSTYGLMPGPSRALSSLGVWGSAAALASSEPRQRREAQSGDWNAVLRSFEWIGGQSLGAWRRQLSLDFGFRVRFGHDLLR